MWDAATVKHENTATAPDGTTIHWSESGTGDAVMLVHGITESAGSWEPIVERLERSHRVITLDLRGHGASGSAPSYDLGGMASDVIAVATAAAVDRPHIVGHSLGGTVVSAVGAVFPVASVVNVDQSMQLADFKAQLGAFEAQLRDADAFPLVISALFEQLSGDLLPAAEADRIGSLRRPDQEVVLGVWSVILDSTIEEIDAVVAGALGGYAGSAVPYLSLFGIDPGAGYEAWLQQFIANSSVELWDGHGHYPHLVEPDRFVERLEEFWAA